MVYRKLEYKTTVFPVNIDITLVRTNYFQLRATTARSAGAVFWQGGIYNPKRVIRSPTGLWHNLKGCKASSKLSLTEMALEQDFIELGILGSFHQG